MFVLCLVGLEGETNRWENRQVSATVMPNRGTLFVLSLGLVFFLWSFGSTGSPEVVCVRGDLGAVQASEVAAQGFLFFLGGRASDAY